jgi:hypothetical protein
MITNSPLIKLQAITTGFLLSTVFTMNAAAVNSLEYELDPYYSNAGYYISLTDEPIPEVTYENETHIYQDMFDSVTASPRFLLIEASVNPLPVAGAYVKKNHRNAYNKAQTSADFNAIQALTEGFEEPYALSLFLGSVVRFVKPNESKDINNRGYTGYLLSIGDKHIVRNDIVDDNWMEIEFKIKGDQDFLTKTLRWSLRAGAKIHDNINITDVIHFGLRRNHFDSNPNQRSLFDNSDIEYKLEFNKDSYELVQQEFFINKKWQIGFSEKSVFSFGIGFIVERGKYSGVLSKSATDLRFIFRPNLQF